MSFSIPVLFITFNRLESTIKVFEQISHIKPKKLYISSDGPRLNKENENDIVNNIREYLLSNVNWDCEIHTLFFENNQGCKIAVSTAITWMFNSEKMGIILEDDCLPNNSFFKFCKLMLNKYENDRRIWHISGYNLFQNKFDFKYDYQFTKYINVWGWATWSDRWKHYNVELNEFDEFVTTNQINNINFTQKSKLFWFNVFQKSFKNKIDTWDYQWVYTVLSNNGLSIIPKNNLIKNIGFGINATHTFDDHIGYSKIQTTEFNEIKHPIFILENISLTNKFNKIFIKKDIFTRIINKIRRTLKY